ncbi:ATP-binding cassette domain-containing protein [Collinsella tanakaei]|nr:ATP-binding cassette domain-containing protein [Collinsella tanakaei]
MIEVRGACVSYRADEPPAVADVTLGFEPGRVVSLVGANGSGKSTLASLLCAMRLCDGGAVRVDGIDPADGASARREVRRRVGLVRQHPTEQLVSTVVFDEVAFGPRNLDLGPDEVRRRVTSALACVGLDGYGMRDTSSLSGGQQQLLAIAGVLAMEPSYLVLDEASSMLDSSARPAHRALVGRLASEMGVGVVQVTHDPLEVLASDRVVIMDRGSVAFDGAPLDLLMGQPALWDATVLPSASVEALRRVCALGFDGRPSATPEAAAAWLVRGLAAGRVSADDVRGTLDALAGALPRALSSGSGAAAGLSLSHVSYGYDEASYVLRDIELAVAPGEVLLVAGRSGSGKSTLASVAAGLFEPDAGTVSVRGRAPRPGDAGIAFQRPEDQLFCESVRDELAFAPRNMGADEPEVARRIEHAAKIVGLDEALFDRYPFDLSGGQARRVAIASVLALDAAAYLFDEPTAGLDAAGRYQMHALARACAVDGRAVIVISHDLEEWMAEVDRVALLSDGRIAWMGTPGELSHDRDAFGAASMEPPLNIALARLLEDALQGGAR